MIAHTPPRTVRAAVVGRTADTPRPGTPVAARRLAARYYADGRVGVAFADFAGALLPARTVDGGRVWRVDGPAMFTPTADGPLAVGPLQSTADGGLQFTTGGGGNVIDTSSDGGRTWYRATFPGTPVAVVPALVGDRDLFTFVQTYTGRRDAPSTEYVSRDAGRTWTRESAFPG